MNAWAITFFLLAAVALWVSTLMLRDAIVDWEAVRFRRLSPDDTRNILARLYVWTGWIRLFSLLSIFPVALVVLLWPWNQRPLWVMVLSRVSYLAVVLGWLLAAGLTVRARQRILHK